MTLFNDKVLTPTRMTRVKKGKTIDNELLSPSKTQSSRSLFFPRTTHLHHGARLNELVKIVECENTNEHSAYPVFYDVDSSEVH